MKTREIFKSASRIVAGGLIGITVWIGISAQCYGQKAEWMVYTTSNSGIDDNVVFITAFDKDGTKWIGTNNGMNRFDGINWTNYRMNNSPLPANIVERIMVDMNGAKWIGTDGVFTTGGGGLAVFNNDQWQTYTPSNSNIPDDWVTAIAEDSQGHKWIGTDNGLAKFDTGYFTVLPAGFYTYYASVSCLAIEKDTIIWIGTGDGLTRYTPTSWTIYRTYNSPIPADNIWAITMDSLNNKWIGMNTGALAKFDGTNWTVYNTTNSGIPVDDVTYISIDKSGTLWLGTWNGGLVSFKDPTWTVYNTSNSLIPSNIVYSVTIDKLGNKWIGTNKGLAIFNKGGILGIDDKPAPPGEQSPVWLGQNQPNPFSSLSSLSFRISSPGHVSLKIYNSMGKEVASLLDQFTAAGTYTMKIDGSALPSGVYMAVLRQSSYSMTRKIMISR